jgi:hypothetical protein
MSSSEGPRQWPLGVTHRTHGSQCRPCLVSEAMATPGATTLTDSSLPTAGLSARVPVRRCHPDSEHLARGPGMVGFLVRTTTAVTVFDVAVWVAVNAIIPLP